VLHGGLRKPHESRGPRAPPRSSPLDLTLPHGLCA
jgi:hypothetical protein